MDGINAVHYQFLAAGFGPGGLSLRALRSTGDSAPLLLHCRGIEVGRLAPDGPIEAGEVIEVPVCRMPRVPLPAELRLSRALDGPDLAPPLFIESASTSLALLGAPQVRVEDLRLEHGVLRGTAREARNGLLEPVLYARINGAGARMASAEAPIALPEGGCAFRFAVPLQPSDLAESGLSVQLHLVGQDAPIASFALTRTLADPERRIAELEGRLRQMEEEVAAQQQNLLTTMQRQIAIQQERIDGFIAAGATLLLDRLAGAPGGGPDALRSLLDAAGPVRSGQPDLDLTARHLRVVAEDGSFGNGWHGPEVYPSGSFRWMSARGLLLNPAPGRPLTGVTLEICHLYRLPSPTLTATLDNAVAEVTVTDCGHGTYSVHLALPGEPRAVRLLRLASISARSPFEDGASPDRRVLSFAVSGVVFHYAD